MRWMIMLSVLCGLSACGELTDVGNPEIPFLANAASPDGAVDQRTVAAYLGEYALAESASTSSALSMCRHPQQGIPKIVLVNGQIEVANFFDYPGLLVVVPATLIGTELIIAVQGTDAALHCTGKLTGAMVVFDCAVTQANSVGSCRLAAQKI